jgi:pilus assembly protein Flp/PilA
MSKLRAFVSDQCGTTAIEYALIAVGISIVMVAAATGIGSKLNTTFTQVQNAFN